MTKRKTELELALDDLPKLATQTERERIQTLTRTMDELNNGDAMEYFGHWLDAVRDALGLED